MSFDYEKRECHVQDEARTPDLKARNVEKIATLFPNCLTEMGDDKGKNTCGSNFELFKQRT